MNTTQDQPGAPLLAELEQLREVVQHLPRTIDGVYCWPGMPLYYIYTLNGRSWVDLAQPTTAANVCYSSKEAASAGAGGAVNAPR